MWGSIFGSPIFVNPYLVPSYVFVFLLPPLPQVMSGKKPLQLPIVLATKTENVRFRR